MSDAEDEVLKIQREFVEDAVNKYIEFKEGECQFQGCYKNRLLVSFPKSNTSLSPCMEPSDYFWHCYLCIRQQFLGMLAWVDIAEKNKDNEKIEMYKAVRDTLVARQVAFEAKSFPRFCVNCKAEEINGDIVDNYNLYVLPLESNQIICKKCFVSIENDKIKMKDLALRLAEENDCKETWLSVLNTTFA